MTTEQDTTLTVTADKLIKVAHFRNREETRYYLCGVLVEPHEDGALLVATDGHILVTWLDREGKCDRPTIVAVPRYLSDLCRPDKSAGPLFGESTRMVSVSGTTATVFDVEAAKKDEPPKTHVIGTVANAAVDGTFPDWRRVAQERPESSGPVGFDPSLLARFSRVLARNEKMTLRLTGETTPARVVWSREPDFFGLVMPMRGGDRELPKWFEPRGDG
jgi:hypothetical protein